MWIWNIPRHCECIATVIITCTPSRHRFLQVCTWFDASLVPIYTQNIDIWIPYTLLYNTSNCQGNRNRWVRAEELRLGCCRIFSSLVKILLRNCYQQISVRYSSNSVDSDATRSVIIWSEGYKNKPQLAWTEDNLISFTSVRFISISDFVGTAISFWIYFSLIGFVSRVVFLGRRSRGERNIKIIKIPIQTGSSGVADLHYRNTRIEIWTVKFQLDN